MKTEITLDSVPSPIVSNGHIRHVYICVYGYMCVWIYVYVLILTKTEPPIYVFNYKPKDPVKSGQGSSFLHFSYGETEA